MLLTLLPKLAGPLADLYIKLAVPMTQIAVAILGIINALISIPGVGHILAFGLAFYIMAQRIGLVSGLLLAWQGIVKAATAVQIAFDIAMDANVIAIIIIAIIALIAIIVLMITHWKLVTKVVGEVWHQITDFVGKIVADVTKFFGNLGAIIEKGWSEFAKRPGYWIGYLIGFIIGKFIYLNQQFSVWFAGIVEKVVAWGVDMAKKAPGALKDFIAKVETEIGKLPGQMVLVGSSIATGLWNGLNAMGPWLLKQIEGFMQGLIAGALKGLGSHSPSTKFAEVGKTIPQGLALGISNNAALAMASLMAMFNQMNGVGARMGTGAGGRSMAGAGAGGRGPINITAPMTFNFPAGSGGNPQMIAQTVQRAIDNEFDHLITRLQGGVYSTPGT